MKKPRESNATVRPQQRADLSGVAQERTPPLPDAPYLPGHSTREDRRRALAFLDAVLPDDPQVPTSPTDWHGDPAWRLGVHLFHHGYFWEAHEAWERLWRRCAPGSEERELLHVLLHYSASALHYRCGRFHAARDVALRAAERLRKLRERGTKKVMGLGLARLAKRLDRHIAAAEQAPGKHSARVPRVQRLPFSRDNPLIQRTLGTSRNTQGPSQKFSTRPSVRKNASSCR